MTDLQKYKKIEKNKEKTIKHRYYIHITLQINGLRNPQNLFHLIMSRQRASEQVKIVRKTVQPDQYRRLDAVFRIGPERRTFRAPADRTADVAQRHGGMSAGDRELVYGLQRLLHGVDTPFEPRNHGRVQRSDLVAPRLARRQQRLDAHQPRKNAVQVIDISRQCVIRAQVVGQQGREGRSSSTEP